MDNNSSKSPAKRDYIQIIKRLWQKRKYILLVTVAFIVFGVLDALLSSEAYTASVTFVPPSSKASNSSFSSLAAIAGINIGDLTGGDDNLYPLAYPQIMESVDFQRDLMYSKIKFEKWDEPISLFDYYQNPKYAHFTVLDYIAQYTIGLPFMILQALAPHNQTINMDVVNEKQDTLPKFIAFSEDETLCVDKMLYTLAISIDEKEGHVTLEAVSSDPYAAAQYCQTAFNLLEKYIVAFRTQKARINYEFVKDRYEAAKADFEEKQRALAEYEDANRIISTAVANTRLARLKSDYSLASTLQNELAKQFLQAELKLKEDTPVLSVIRPVSIPFRRSKPHRTALVVLFTFMGVIAACGSVLLFDKLKAKGSKWPKRWTLPGEEPVSPKRKHRRRRNSNEDNP